MTPTEQELRRQLAHRKRAAANTLFDYLFLLRHGRMAAYWEARLGEALVLREIEIKRQPHDVGLRQVHEVAAEVLDNLTTSEAWVVSAA